MDRKRLGTYRKETSRHGERRSLEVGVARKNYRSHIIRAKGWKNECVGYHIKGDIFDAAVAKSIVEIEGKQCCLM